MKVLVVEDDPDIRELLTLFFEAKGHAVETANDGQEALRQLQHVQPDLILLDVVLPKLDGWGVLTAVRAQRIIRRLEPVAEPQRIARGAIEIDERAKTVTIHGEPIALSPKEFYHLALLASNLGRVYTNEEIITGLWGSDSRATGADVKQSIYQLRSKIKRDPHSPQWIRNVKGFGYKLVV